MCVESCGSPPFETSQITLRLLNVQIVPSVIAGSSTGFNSGSVMCQNCCQRDGAVDAGRFVQLGGNALHAAERDDHHERKTEPDVGDDAGLRTRERRRPAS